MDPRVPDGVHRKFRIELPARDGVDPAPVSRQGGESCDEWLQSEKRDEQSVQRSSKSAGGDGERNRRVSWHSKNRIQVKQNHRSQADVRSDAEIDPTRDDRERLADRQNGHEGIAGEKVLDVRCGQESASKHGKQRE